MYVRNFRDDESEDKATGSDIMHGVADIRMNIRGPLCPRPIEPIILCLIIEV